MLAAAAYGQSQLAFIVPRVLELVYTAWDLAPFAADLWADADEALRARLLAQHDANRAATGGHPWAPPAWANLPATPNSLLPISPFKWDDERRALLRAELDAYYARLYGLTRDELRYILDPKEVYGPDFPGETFRVLKEKEEKHFGEYRTRRLVLAAWDRLEAELGPAVLRNYREELAAAAPRLAEAKATYAADTPRVPQFGVTPAAKDSAPAPLPSANQPDLFGAAAIPSASSAQSAPESADSPSAQSAAESADSPSAQSAAKSADSPSAQSAAESADSPSASQPVLIPAPPQGSRMQRISRLLAISKERSSRRHRRTGGQPGR